MYANNAGTGYANANIFYLFLGAQPQWGINTGGAVRTSTLPIPFTNVFLAVASTSSEWCCPGCSATNTTVTTRAYQSNRPDVAQPNDVNWIIIGCQPQWGLSTGQADLTTILPFPMTESFISLCCANSYWTNAGCDVSNTAITLSQAQTDKASTRHYGPLCWIVLGKQTVGIWKF